MRGRVVLTASASLDASENTHTFYPPGTARTGYPVIFLHGAGLNDMICANSGWPHGALLGRTLSRAGIATAQIYGNGTNMANDTGMSRITTALSTLATRTGCSSSKCHLIGISMGGAWAIRYAALNPSVVASVNALVPATTLVKLLQKNPGSALTAAGFSGLVATAWGLTLRILTDVTVTSGSPNISSAAGFLSGDVNRVLVDNTGAFGAYNNKIPFGTTLSSQAGTTAVMSANATSSATNRTVILVDPLPVSGSPNADLLGLAPAIATATIPGRLFYSTVDPYIEPADVTALATAAGWSATSIDSTYGHADGSLSQWAAYNSGTNFSDLVTYLIANGA